MEANTVIKLYCVNRLKWLTTAASKVKLEYLCQCLCCQHATVPKPFPPYPALVSMRHHKEALNSRFCFVLSARLIRDAVPLHWICFILWMRVSDI